MKFCVRINVTVNHCFCVELGRRIVMGRKSCSIRFRALFMSICMLLTFFPVYYTPKEAKAMGSIDMPGGNGAYIKD